MPVLVRLEQENDQLKASIEHTDDEAPLPGFLIKFV